MTRFALIFLAACTHVTPAREMNVPATMPEVPAPTPSLSDEDACHLGSGIACLSLGMAYKKGDGVAVDSARARAAFERACDADSAPGCLTLAAMFESGEGGPVDKKQAADLYERACASSAENGPWRLAGCMNLGTVYDHGDGERTRNEARARTLFARTCDAKFPLACVYLADCLVEGHGGRIDRARAHTLYQQACNDGLEVACEALASRH